MTFSFRIRREHGAFAASAISRGGIVPVRVQGCLRSVQPHDQGKHQDLAPAQFEPLPSSLAGSLRELVEHSSEVALRALAFYSAAVLYCVGNGWRRLVASFPSRAPASALSPRLSETRLPLPLVQACKQSGGSFSNRLETCVRGFAPASHEQRKPRENVNGVPKVWERGTHECS